MDCCGSVCEAENHKDIFYTGIVLMELGNCWCFNTTRWFTRPYNFLTNVQEVHGHLLDRCSFTAALVWECK